MSNINPTIYSDKYFGGTEKVRVRLRDAIQKARTDKKYTEAYLNGVCGFGRILRRKSVRLPTCEEFEAHPEIHMNSLVFSLASFPLDLKIDEALPIALNDEAKIEIAAEMSKNHSGAKRGAGGGDATTIPLKDQASVYVLSKILDEIDKDTLKKGETDDKPAGLLSHSAACSERSGTVSTATQ